MRITGIHLPAHSRCFKDFVPVDLAVPTVGGQTRVTLGLAVDMRSILSSGVPSNAVCVAGVQIQRSAVVVNVVVIRNADRVFIEPVAD
jgi:hypothetical protein